LTPSIESFLCEGADGLQLHGRKWRVDKPKATILGVHGFSEHSGRYRHVAEYLNTRSFDVFWIDLPGHGLSQGKRNDCPNFKNYVVALEQLVREAQRAQSKGPYHLFAHSLGALSAIRFLQSSALATNICSSVLSGPLLGLFRFPSMILPFLQLLASIIPNLTLNNKDELGADVLTHDLEMQKSRSSDPLVNAVVTTHWVREFVKARRMAFAEVEKIQIPTLILKAELERVVDPNEIDRFFELLSVPKKELKLYPGMFHEVVNEIERFRVMSDIANWFEAQTL